ncbi:MAG TPA: glycerophosphodiester phosphodiesterase [Anaerolineae bacterium]|nr:glycerophosphodiester phosphodiesterase [Anaerolineae bacterium]
MKRALRRTVIMLLVIAVVMAIYRLLTIHPLPQKPYLALNRPMILAHRGGMALMPENTLEAFQNALAVGADALELDIHSSADGELVVIHDETVDRTTDGHGRVHDMTWEQLQALDAGYRWTPDGGKTYPYRGQGLRIPSLRQVLTTFPNARVNIEIKQADPPIVTDLVQLIEETGAWDRVLVTSFDTTTMRHFRTMEPDVASGAAEDEIRTFYAFQLLRLTPFYRPVADAFQVPESYDSIHVVTKRFVESAHHHRIAVHVWTVDDPADMRRLLELGVDGLITNRPDLARQVLTEMGYFERSQE